MGITCRLYAVRDGHVLNSSHSLRVAEKFVGIHFANDFCNGNLANTYENLFFERGRLKVIVCLEINESTPVSLNQDVYRINALYFFFIILSRNVNYFQQVLWLKVIFEVKI